MNYKEKYIKYKKKYLDKKKKGGMNPMTQEFVPKKTDKIKKKMNPMTDEFVPKKNIPIHKKILSSFYEKNELVIVSHNLGGQTFYQNENDKSYLSLERGEIIPNTTKTKYKTIEQLNKDIPPPKLTEDVDIYLFQEWQTQDIQGQRINDLVIQTKLGKFLSNNKRQLNYSEIYLIDTLEKLPNENIIIKNVHLPIASDTSSINQLRKLINELSSIVEQINTNKKLIIGGDFNFDFSNIDEELNELNKTLRNSRKSGVKSVAEELGEQLRTLYTEFTKNIVFAVKKTNIWSLPMNGPPVEKCVDYIMISKNLEEYIDLENCTFDIDESFIEGSLGEPVKFLENDYDHARLRLKIVFNERFRIIY